MKRSYWIILFAGLAAVTLTCCICAALVPIRMMALSAQTSPTDLVEPWPSLSPFSAPTSTPQVARMAEPVIPDSDLRETLETLENADIPTADLRDLARRLEGKQEIPLTLPPPPAPLTVGTPQTFWVTNVDSNENFLVTATLRYVTDHLYFWVEQGIFYDRQDLEQLAETFENEIYPTTRAFFGSEWTPGVDGDPHLYILYAANLGYSLAGYYSSVDEYHPLTHEYSNAHEMFLINADNLYLDEEFTYSVLAHEFQHMIHWYRDKDEEAWLNEGFSELASLINGYEGDKADFAYTSDPDLQLNTWPNASSPTTPHYGAAFLFVTYLLDRFGSQTTQALVANPANGLASVDEVLAEAGATDPLTGKTVTADDLVMDWMLATYLQDERIGDGRYTYSNYPSASQSFPTETIHDCPTETLNRTVNQYGVDYIRIRCKGNITLGFQGATQAALVPENPYSGSYAFWSNRGDEADMTLTRSFDFRDHSGPLTLTYWTWYDLEADFDYLYLEASRDGENWEILTTPDGTPSDPTGNSFGWGYNGYSGYGPRWIQEKVDLSRFAGEEALIRFEYLTDAAVNGEGFLLDDVAVPELGYFTDFEADDGGWDARGFVRIQNGLPQTFRLAIIASGDETRVDYIDLAPDNTSQIPLDIGGDVDEVILVVTGTTRFTTQPASYQLLVEK